jgi:hypothetical protein
MLLKRLVGASWDANQHTPEGFIKNGPKFEIYPPGGPES